MPAAKTTNTARATNVTNLPLMMHLLTPQLGLAVTNLPLMMHLLTPQLGLALFRKFLKAIDGACLRSISGDVSAHLLSVSAMRFI